MTSTPREDTAVNAVPGLRVSLGGSMYRAEEIARGAAYKLFSPYEQPGFKAGPHGWYRFVHASEVGSAHGAGRDSQQELDEPLRVPLSRSLGWTDVHRLTQTGRASDCDGECANGRGTDCGTEAMLAAIRQTATVRRGSRMVKVLSAHQVGGYLRGWMPAGFCYREYDIAHLRTPAELRLLRTDPSTPADSSEVAFVLRWRAVDGSDYQTPTSTTHAGMTAIPPHDRVGAPVLGTGFTPSDQHVIPEFVTADLVDLPLTANAALLAYTADGTEVVLFTYQPEQRGWLRMVGPAWRHLLDGLGGARVDQDYVPLSRSEHGTSRLIGWFRGQQYETVADPPDEFRLLAMTRAARYPVEALARRTRYATWRGARCAVVRDDGAWVRVRLCRPDPDQIATLSTQCHERGVYEAWAPANELADRVTVDHPYQL